MIRCVGCVFEFFKTLVVRPIHGGVEKISNLARCILGFCWGGTFSLSGRKTEPLARGVLAGKLEESSSQYVKTANLFLSITGNPSHMGHMHMVALAVEALVQKGYQIGRVRIALSSEGYAKEKVHWQNISIQKHNEKILEEQDPEMLKVLIPRLQRIEFLREVILEAKREGMFENSLDIDCWEGAPDDLSKNLSSREWPSGKVFYVCGSDFAEEKPDFLGENQVVKHAVVIGRQGSNFSKPDSDDLIFVKNDSKTCEISSSKIQNGKYELLPSSIRDSFIKLHQEKQPKAKEAFIEAEERFAEEIEKISCPIAKATKKAIEKGYYIAPSGLKISLRKGKELFEESEEISNQLLIKPVEARYGQNLEIAVVKQDCLEAAKEELKSGAKKVALLVLSSPLEPGGAMEEGNQGQEEEVCRRSNLFDFMWDQSHFLAPKSFYNLVDLQRADEKNPDFSSMKNNKMLHVPRATVFRAGAKRSYGMLEDPFEVGMLVSPGLNRPSYSREGDTWDYIRSEDREQLCKLITTQLLVAYHNGYDTVILGAFGCGAFQNPPELVASFYKKIIDEFFPRAFRRIVFAILDDPQRGAHNPEGNFKPFQKCFAVTDSLRK